MRNLVALIFVCLIALGCASAEEADPPTGSALIFATVTPLPVPLPTTESAPPAAPTALTAPHPEDLSFYRQVMRPAFADDVDRLAEAGITRYKIEATLHPESMVAPAEPQLSGRMAVHFTNTESVLLNQVYFRLFPNTPSYGGAMDITAVSVNGREIPPVLLAEGTTLEVSLPQTIAPGEAVDVALEFTAAIPTTADYGYGLYSFDRNILTLSGFYPTIPVFDNQGWHIEVLPLYGDSTYTDVALFDVTLTAPQEMVIVTSGDVLTRTVSTDGQQTVRAFTGPMRDFFVAMSDGYRSTEQEVNGVTVTSYYPAGYEQSGEFMLGVAARSIDIFSDLFGPYPYRSFDVTTAPMPVSLGGFEYPGVIVMARRYYEQMPGELEEFVTAHEVGHQWWYGLVGSDQVNTPWLDEALTQYAAVLYFEQRYGAHKRAELVNLYFWPPYNLLLNTGTDRPVAGPVSEFTELEYSNVVYGKGPLFFEALRDQLGDPRFLAALRRYAETNRYDVVAPADLLATLEQTGGSSVDWIYERWILGE